MTTVIDPIPAPARALVVTLDPPRVVLGHGRINRPFDYIPAGMLTDVGWVLDKFAEMARGEGVVILPFPPVEWGEQLPEQLPECCTGAVEILGHGHARTCPNVSQLEQLEQLVKQADAAGWSAERGALELAREGASGGWVTFTSDNRPTIHLGIAPWIDPDTTPLFDPAGPADDTAALLAAYHHATGVAWRYTAGASGIAAIRATAAEPAKPGQRRPEPRWTQTSWKADNGITGRGDILWSRQLSAAEHGLAEAHGIHQFDVRAAYLAAAAAAPLGWGALTNTGTDADTGDPRAGYYRIRLRSKAGKPAGPPVVNPIRVARDGTTWVTAPVVAYLNETGESFEILDSWTAERTGRYLRTWAERLRDQLVLGAHPERVKDALKRTYVEAIGLMSRPGGRLYRRDWAHTVEDYSAVSLLRKVRKVRTQTGLWPVRVHVDAVYYVGTPEQLEAVSGLLVGPRIGNLKPEGTETVAEHTARWRRQARR